MEATTRPESVHIYFDVKAGAIVGDVDLLILDRSGAIVARTDVTADGLPETELAATVDAQLSVFAAIKTNGWDSRPVAQFRNFDGRVGYLTSALLVTL